LNDITIELNSLELLSVKIIKIRYNHTIFVSGILIYYYSFPKYSDLFTNINGFVKKIIYNNNNYKTTKIKIIIHKIII